MNIENMLLLNFIFTVGLAFWTLRTTMSMRHDTERYLEQTHQEIRNNVNILEEKINRNVDYLQREVDVLHEQVYNATKKKTTGINSRIPL